MSSRHLLTSTMTPVGTIIRERLDRRGWSQNKLAAEADVGKSTISRLMHDETLDPTLRTLYRIACALGIDPTCLYCAVLDVPYEHDALAERIAQRVTALPDELRPSADRAITSLLDALTLAHEQ